MTDQQQQPPADECERFEAWISIWRDSDEAMNAGYSTYSRDHGQIVWEGWKARAALAPDAVPREPTEAMIAAGAQIYWAMRRDECGIADLWQAMWDVARRSHG